MNSEQGSSAFRLCWKSFTVISEQRKAGSHDEDRAASCMGLERCRRGSAHELQAYQECAGFNIARPDCQRMP
jgi:hypothetical protein